MTAKDEQRFIISWADELIKTAEYNGVLHKDCFEFTWFGNAGAMAAKYPTLRKLREVAFSLSEQEHPDPSNVDKPVRKLIYFLDNVKAFLLREGYIIISSPQDKSEWLLTEKGKLVKELGGHAKYVKYRRREINVLSNQAKVNRWLIAGAILAAVMPFVVYKLEKDDKATEKTKAIIDSLLKIKPTQQLTPPPVQPQTKFLTPLYHPNQRDS